MKELSETLLDAQQRNSRRPCLEVKVTNVSGGVVRADWEECYAGAEPAGPHGAVSPSDGSLVRVRVTPLADARKLYRQRVASPGPEDDFSQWTYTGYYNVVAVAVAAYGNEVSIIWIESNRQVRRIVSSDCGVSFGSPETVDYAPATAVNGIAAAYRPGGNLTVFFVCQSTLYVKKRVGGSWQTRTSWDKATGQLSGVASAYSGDWLLLVSGQDTTGAYRLWSLIHGDGGMVPAGSWSALSVLASAPAGGDFQYRHPFLAVPDVVRCSFVEVYSGESPYQRVFMSHLPAAAFSGNLWCEPAPLPVVAEHGLALASAGDTAWASTSAAVLRTSLEPTELDISADVASLSIASGRDAGGLEIELRNDSARYASPGQGSLTLLSPGNSVTVSLGYATASGSEAVPSGSFRIEALEHVTRNGTAVLRITASDAWQSLSEWRAPCQFRWNRTTSEKNIRDIIRFIAARAGLNLVERSSSPELTSLYPDFTLHPGSDGRAALHRLLAMVEDAVIAEGETLYLFHPQPDDAPLYSYGNGHGIIESRLACGQPAVTRVQVEGWDSAAGKKVVVESFNWVAAAAFPGRRVLIDDRNMTSAAAAGKRGQAALRKAMMSVSLGCITVPVNCCQQAGDVIDITDVSGGLMSEPRRVDRLAVVYNPHRGEYVQRLELGPV